MSIRKKVLFLQPLKRKRRVVRVVEGARLESVYRPKAYLGFESLTLRNKKHGGYRAFLR